MSYDLNMFKSYNKIPLGHCNIYNKYFKLFKYMENNEEISREVFLDLGFRLYKKTANTINKGGKFLLEEYKNNHYAIIKL